MRTSIALALALLAGALAAQAPAPHDPFCNLRFRELGPVVAGGRVTSVVGIPGNPRIYYVGTAGGGVFKSTDAGEDWTAIFAHEPVASIGALAIAPSDPNTVWVGTGEANVRNDVLTGGGVYVSHDAGRTWQFAGLKNAGQIAAVMVSPTGTVLIGVTGDAWGPSTERGVFRTTDGGRTWNKVLYVNDSTGVSDMAVDPANPQIIYAGMWQIRRYPWKMVSGGAGSGIYKSTDGGATWRRLSLGLPPAPTGRSGLAVSPTNPRHVYAFVESKQGILWDSLDGGDHWRLISRNWLLDARPWYFCRLAVSPRDENTVYLLSFNLLESKDGGRTVFDIGHGVHPDNHTIWIDPKNPNRIIEGNDGGVYISADAGQSWRFADGLPIEQTYSVAVDNRTPFSVCAGLQDNGAWCGPSAILAHGRIPNEAWWAVTGGDGQYAVQGPHTNWVYADSQNGVISRRDRVTGAGGQIRPSELTIEEELQSKLRYRFDWTSPIAVNPSDGREVYLGGNVVFRSQDAGARWQVISPDLTRNDKSKQGLSGGPVENDLSGAETYDTILSIAVAPEDPETIWVGTDDGLVQVTFDGGRLWQNVTPKSVPTWGRVEQIAVSPFNPKEAYAAFDRHESDDNRAYVMRTRDGGATWESIVAGLPPDTPVHVVREDPNRRGLLVAGTDTGLFYSRDDGATWASLTAGFPTASVVDLKFQKPTHSVVVATHGRGLLVLDDITPLEQMTPARAQQALTLFTPTTAIRASLYNRYTIATHAAEWTASNRQPGAIIQYYLREAVPGGVRIVVSNAAGEVRRLRGPGEAGVNRVIWDLTYDPAPRPAILAHTVQAWVPPTAGGPPAVPGRYKVAVAAGGLTRTVALLIAPDPRFPEDLSAMQAQTAAGLQTRKLISQLVSALDRSQHIQEQLAGIESSLVTSGAHPQLLTRAKKLERQIVAWRAPLFNPAIASDSKYYLHSIGSIFDRLQRLMTALNGGYGVAPTPAMVSDEAELGPRVNAAGASLDQWVSSKLAAFNQAARAADVRPVDTGPGASSRRAVGMRYHGL